MEKSLYKLCKLQCSQQNKGNDYPSISAVARSHLEYCIQFFPPPTHKEKISKKNGVFVGQPLKWLVAGALVK